MRVSGNIANPSKSEKCQDIFRDLQKDLVVMRYLMLLFTYQTVCVFNIYKGKKDLSGVQAASSPKRRAFLLVGVGHLNVCEANFTLSEAKQFDRPADVQ